MNEKDWILLKTISEEKNITKAAERLYISQPAITYRLKMMEREFQVKLATRTPTGIILTDQGEYLLAYVENMIRQLTQTKERLLNMGNKVHGSLRIAASAVFANYALPQILKGFLDCHPEVDISLQTGRSRQVIRMLEKQDVSVIIVRGNYPWPEEKLLLCQEPICLITRTPVEIKELPHKPRIIYGTDSSLQIMIDKWCRQTFLRPLSVSIKVDTMDTCRRMVSYDLGWAIVPTIGLNEYDSLHSVKLFWENGEPLLRETWLFCHFTSMELSAVRAFVEFMKACNSFPSFKG